MFKIIVETEQEKQELLQASRLLHNKRHLNLRHPGINTFAHLYCAPELIEVQPTVNEPSTIAVYSKVNGIWVLKDKIGDIDMDAENNFSYGVEIRENGDSLTVYAYEPKDEKTMAMLTKIAKSESSENTDARGTFLFEQSVFGKIAPSLLGDVQEIDGVKEVRNVSIRSFDIVDK